MYALMRSRLSLFIVVLALAMPAVADCTYPKGGEPGNLNFGAYSVFSATPATASTPYKITCTPGSTGTLKISAGVSGNISQRNLKKGTEVALYNIYMDAGGTQIWGDSTGGFFLTVTNATGANVNYTGFIYAIAPALQDLVGDPPPGPYSDTTVTATLAWTNTLGGSGIAKTTLLNSSLTVTKACRVDAFNLTFGVYDPFAVAATTTSTFFKVYCTRTTAVTSITLDNGANALLTQRRMKQTPGGAFMNYNPTMSVTTGTSTSSLTPINSPGFAIAGSIPASQEVPQGGYVDTLVATVNY